MSEFKVRSVAADPPKGNNWKTVAFGVACLLALLAIVLAVAPNS